MPAAVDAIYRVDRSHGLLSVPTKTRAHTHRQAPATRKTHVRAPARAPQKRKDTLAKIFAPLCTDNERETHCRDAEAIGRERLELSGVGGVGTAGKVGDARVQQGRPRGPVLSLPLRAPDEPRPQHQSHLQPTQTHTPESQARERREGKSEGRGA